MVAALGLSAPASASAAPPASCGLPGPDQAASGTFEASRQGSFVFVPFDVPAGHHAGAGGLLLGPLAGHERPHAGPGRLPDRAATPGTPWGRARVPRLGRVGLPGRDDHPAGLLERGAVRGRPQGLRARAAPRARSCPGPIPAGRWAAELGLANIDPTDLDGVGYRVEVKYYRDRGVRRRRPTAGRRATRHAGPGGDGLVRGRFPRARRALGRRPGQLRQDAGLRVPARGAGGPGLDFVAADRPQHGHGLARGGPPAR